MSDLVQDIEKIVGLKRHATAHIGRAVSSEQTFYIMHSQECVDTGIDLRECPFSLALDDYGIGEEWEGWEDKPVALEIDDCGFLQPKKEASDEEAEKPAEPPNLTFKGYRKPQP